MKKQVYSLTALALVFCASNAIAALDCKWRYNPQFTQMADSFKRNLQDARFLEPGLQALCDCFDQAKQEGKDVNECQKKSNGADMDMEKYRSMWPEEYSEENNPFLLSDDEIKRKYLNLNRDGDVIDESSGQPICIRPKQAVYTMGVGWRCQER